MGLRGMITHSKNKILPIYYFLVLAVYFSLHYSNKTYAAGEDFGERAQHFRATSSQPSADFNLPQSNRGESSIRRGETLDQRVERLRPFLMKNIKGLFPLASDNIAEKKPRLELEPSQSPYRGSLQANIEEFSSNNDKKINVDKGKGPEDYGGSLSTKSPENFDKEDKKSTNYMNKRTMLFLGGGDLSYERSYVEKHPERAEKMIATTFDSEQQMYELYENSANNKKYLKSKGVLIFHEVDATKLDENESLKKILLPKDIYFSHPHTGSRKKGEHTSNALIEPFFEAASKLQQTGELIHIPRVRGGKRDRNPHYKGVYGFYISPSIKKYELIHKFRFNGRYPGYEHKETKNNKSSASVLKHNSSLEYIFKRIPEGIETDYKSDHINSDVGSPTYSDMESIRNQGVLRKPKG
jgi:hypothetical protein